MQIQNHQQNKHKHLQNTNCNALLVNKSWQQLQVILLPQVMNAIKMNGFQRMLPVQQAGIPLLLKNYDVAIEAQTGSGKTLAFIIPLMQRFLNDLKQNLYKLKHTYIRYLIISPTRQLIQQTNIILQQMLGQQYSKWCKCITGGSNNTLQYDSNIIQKQCYILLGTVGRINQIRSYKDVNWLKKVQYLYIDQADRVLKQKGINNLINSIQKQRRTALFSATLQGLHKKQYDFYGMRNLAKISLKHIQIKNKNKNNNNNNTSYIIPKSLLNNYLILQNRLDKIIFLIQFIIYWIKKNKIIVFFNTCASVDFYSKILQFYLFSYGIQQECIYGLHGKMKNKKRMKIMNNFKNSSFGCLVATDVISRGIDFQEIHYIVQIDPPQDPDNYIHRIGRTARINKPGTAILLIEAHEQSFITYLQNKNVGIKQVKHIQQYTEGIKGEQPQIIKKNIEQLMITDRDYIEKSKKAFVSYIRSYKQHDLKYIFEFNNVDLGMTARSFFLLKIPRIKEILGKNIKNFQNNNIIHIENIIWKNKNQQKQYQLKKINHLQKIQTFKWKNNQNQNQKNNKSYRKRIRKSKQFKMQQQIDKEYRQIKKQKKQKTKFINRMDDESQDTQELQRIIQNRMT